MKQMARKRTYSYTINNSKKCNLTRTCDDSSIRKKNFKPLVDQLPIVDQSNGENANHREWKPRSPSSSKSYFVVPSPTNMFDLSDQIRPSSQNNETTKVITAKNWHKDTKLDYKMSSRPRGPCLIVNNVNFEDNIFPKRLGSDKDANRLGEVFRQLGFDVQLMRDLTSHKMKSFFMQASVSCKHRYDALVVILLSHGTESAIYGTDGIEMDLNNIISLFDNKRCKQMIGKPKLFIVQACRGRNADYGVKGHDVSLFTSQPESPPQSQSSQLTQSIPISPQLSRLGEFDEKCQPTRTDMLLCFSCNPGFVSVRNEDAGSWLCMSLALHLKKNSCKNHFMEIINMVSQDVRQRISTEGHKQVIEITWIGFDKNLYFNPGLYDQ